MRHLLDLRAAGILLPCHNYQASPPHLASNILIHSLIRFRWLLPTILCPDLYWYRLHSPFNDLWHYLLCQDHHLLLKFRPTHNYWGAHLASILLPGVRASTPVDLIWNYLALRCLFGPLLRCLWPLVLSLRAECSKAAAANKDARAATNSVPL